MIETILIIIFLIFCFIYLKHLKTKEPRSIKDAKKHQEIIKKQAQRILDIINESIDIARRSKNRETQISRLNLANEELDQLRQYIVQYPFLSITGNGFEKLQSSIDELHNQLRFHDYQNSNNDQTINFESVFREFSDKRPDNKQFWADRIKDYRNDPGMRLQIAIENLPYPAAFREAAIALRAIIRDKRKSGAKYQDQLDQLYWLAAVNSFSIPYSEALREPGFNVMERIPASEIKKFTFSYDDVGYKELSLLNKTDIKWITELWGEPSNHSTLHLIHADVWKKHEKYLLDEKNKFFAGAENKYIDFSKMNHCIDKIKDS